MRIGVIVPGGVHASGTEHVIPALLWLLERVARHHTVTVVALIQYPHPCTYSLGDVKVYNLGRRGPRLPGGWVPAYVGEIGRIARAERWDLIHVFWAGQTGWLAGLIGRRYRLPVLLHLAGGELVAFPDIGYGGQLGYGQRWLVQQSMQSASHITAASAPMQDMAAVRGFRVTHLPLGVPASDYARSTGAGRRLLHVANLNRVKDQPTLLRAFQRVALQDASVHLDIIGFDTLNGAMQRLALELGLSERVTFHDQMPNIALRPWYQQAALYLHSSRHEAGPMVAIEAAASGVPTVGTRVGHIAEWDGKEAQAVAVADDMALATATLQLLEDAPRRQQTAQAAWEWANTHTADRTALRFMALYEQLMDDYRRS